LYLTDAQCDITVSRIYTTNRRLRNSLVEDVKSHVSLIRTKTKHVAIRYICSAATRRCIAPKHVTSNSDIKFETSSALDATCMQRSRIYSNLLSLIHEAVLTLSTACNKSTQTSQTDIGSLH